MEETTGFNVVAIDGPSGSGKSTLARNLARVTGYLHVDSGSMYRAVTWKAIEGGIDVNDAEALVQMLDKVRMEFSVEGERIVYRMDGVDPGDAIRTQAVNDKVSPVSTVPRVRDTVTTWLRNLRELGSLVMEGRDIGTVVFPDATCKFYLVCEGDERAKRRHVQFGDLNSDLSVKDVQASLLTRDRIDSGRKTAPLKQADDAIAIDNTDLTPEQTLQYALDRLPSSIKAHAAK